MCKTSYMTEQGVASSQWVLFTKAPGVIPLTCTEACHRGQAWKNGHVLLDQSVGDAFLCSFSNLPSFKAPGENVLSDDLIITIVNIHPLHYTNNPRRMMSLLYLTQLGAEDFQAEK